MALAALGSKMRLMISEWSGSPGTMGVWPVALGLVASSRRSSRMPIMRELLSGP